MANAGHAAKVGCAKVGDVNTVAKAQQDFDRGQVLGLMVLALIRLTIICCRNFEGRHKIPHFCVAVPSAVVAWGLGMLVQEIIHEEIAWMVFFVVWLGL